MRKGKNRKACLDRSCTGLMYYLSFYSLYDIFSSVLLMYDFLLLNQYEPAGYNYEPLLYK
jgi:hypothetical protein